MNEPAASLAWLGEETGSQINLGLARMHGLLHQLGRPDAAIRYTLHIAGTNGKGSVARMAAAIMQATGSPTALYTSPALEDPAEVMQINGQPPTPGQLYQLVKKLRPAAAHVSQRLDSQPTPFERWTAALFLWAATTRVAGLVLEAGLGGRLDATNAVAYSQVAVITDVSLDHTALLGSTAAAIATEKAGIIKPGMSVITAAQGEVLQIIAATAQQRGAALYTVEKANNGTGQKFSQKADQRPAQINTAGTYQVSQVTTGLSGTSFTCSGPGLPPTPLHVPLLGRHQAINGALAAAAVAQLVRHGWPGRDTDWPDQRTEAKPKAQATQPLNPEIVQRGLAGAQHPGRLELWSRQPAILLDLAHNPQAMMRLVETVTQLFPRRRLVLLCGLLADKAIAEIVAAWRPARPWRIITTAPENPRALAAAELARHFNAAGFTATPAVNWQQGWQQASAALADAGPTAMLCVCGSTYLVGPVRRWLARPKSPK